MEPTPECDTHSRVNAYWRILWNRGKVDLLRSMCYFTTTPEQALHCQWAHIIQHSGVGVFIYTGATKYKDNMTVHM